MIQVNVDEIESYKRGRRRTIPVAFGIVAVAEDPFHQGSKFDDDLRACKGRRLESWIWKCHPMSESSHRGKKYRNVHRKGEAHLIHCSKVPPRMTKYPPSLNRRLQHRLARRAVRDFHVPAHRIHSRVVGGWAQSK